MEGEFGGVKAILHAFYKKKKRVRKNKLCSIAVTPRSHFTFYLILDNYSTPPIKRKD